MGRVLRENIGEKYGRLTVIDIIEPHVQPSGKKMQMRRCLCDCGNVVDVAAQSLQNGRTKSCGCLRSEVSKEVHTKNIYHHDRLHRIWAKMKQRCQTESNINYKNWGARGIYVCDEWQGFDAFCEWALDHGYSDHLSIDRIDNNGPYCPENCRWVDAKLQANNRRSNHFLTVDGTTKTLAQWSEESGVAISTIFARLKYGWSAKDSVFTPVRNQHKRVTTTASPTASSPTCAATSASTIRWNGSPPS